MSNKALAESRLVTEIEIALVSSFYLVFEGWLLNDQFVLWKGSQQVNVPDLKRQWFGKSQYFVVD